MVRPVARKRYDVIDVVDAVQGSSAILAAAILRFIKRLNVICCELPWRVSPSGLVVENYSARLLGVVLDPSLAVKTCPFAVAFGVIPTPLPGASNGIGAVCACILAGIGSGTLNVLIVPTTSTLSVLLTQLGRIVPALLAYGIAAFFAARVQSLSAMRILVEELSGCREFPFANRTAFCEALHSTPSLLLAHLRGSQAVMSDRFSERPPRLPKSIIP